MMIIHTRRLARQILAQYLDGHTLEMDNSKLSTAEVIDAITVHFVRVILHCKAHYDRNGVHSRYPGITLEAIKAQLRLYFGDRQDWDDGAELVSFHFTSQLRMMPREPVDKPFVAGKLAYTIF
jgi:hypothetical protein